MHTSNPTTSPSVGDIKPLPTKVLEQLRNFDHLPDSAHVGTRTVLALMGVKSAATLWKWEHAKKLPRAKKIGGSNRNAWNVGELRACLAGKEADHAPAA